MDLVVLAGGKSRRMGAAARKSGKAHMRFDRKSLIETVISRLRPLFEHVIVCSATGSEFPDLDASEVADIYANYGSIAGLHAGLSAAGPGGAFAVACDMPFVNPELVKMLMARVGKYDVVVPRLAAQKLEPLHAVYSKACLPHVEALLQRHQLRIYDFFRDANVNYVDLEEIREIDPELRSFLNVNTPEDLARARDLLARAGGMSSTSQTQ
jgi:molybdopterin-guanine dinucleotide biosynthesis protein A